ncbi:MAG: carbon storage regulator [Bacillota bacterium]|uniref:Translational regulator CsrA n=1 Tax=[Clostridium] aminophilum TaxID=1526 RepID=A0A1I6K0V1_9FIRM|nr:carbon storage regulator [[Clostridium] aminophilum]MCR4628863.1 carbon storage regulator [Clostridium sp.]MDT3844969.1 carbon storage regulator [Bacillota bacterium]SFR84728.1 carbon storage regulator, CsrA [[Clostridium] aminophilum]
MLILRRKKNESILIGKDIRITVVESAADGVRLAIDAPRQVSIIREELSNAEAINREAISSNATSVDQMIRRISSLRQNNEADQESTGEK